MLFFGDSYTEGSAMGGYNDNGWPAITCQRVGCIYDLDAVGGSGFTARGPGGGPFPTRVDDVIVQQPDVVVVEGGHNDSDPDATADAAAEVLRRLQAGLPDATMLMLGPIWQNGDPPPEQVEINQALREVADDAGVRFVSPIDRGWFAGDKADLIGRDGVHPTNAGHRYLADLMAPIVARTDPRLRTG